MCSEQRVETYRPPLKNIIVSKCRKRAVIDITYLKESDGYKYLVIVVDAFSKKAWARALKNRDAASILKFLQEVFGDEVNHSFFIHLVDLYTDCL